MPLVINRAAGDGAAGMTTEPLTADTEATLGAGDSFVRPPNSEQELRNSFPPTERFATILTMVEVDAADPAFANPTKFVGPVYSEEQAQALAEEKGWPFRKDGGSWRRVVPSPRPQHIFELDAIRALIDLDVVVICAGGGGIPTLVTRSDGKPVLALGGSGGTRIATGVAQTLLAHLVFGKSAAEAVADPRIETPPLGGIVLDEGVPDALATDLKTRGELPSSRPNYSAIQLVTAGMRDGARHERERARAEQEAALNAVRAEHDAELLRRDALLERKLAEQRVEIRGAAFWRAAFTLGVPLALGSAVAGATFALGAAQTGMFGGLAAAERAALIAPREPQELTVSDPDLSLPDVAPEPAARRQGQEPANAP